MQEDRQEEGTYDSDVMHFGSSTGEINVATQPFMMSAVK
jgi:hypothetical protein